MTELPPEAVEAVARVLADREGWTSYTQARAVLVAALPHLERHDEGPSLLLTCDDDGLPETVEVQGRTLVYEPGLRAQIAGEQQKVLDRELDRYDPADNYGEAVEHDLVADIGRKLITVAREGAQ